MKKFYRSNIRSATCFNRATLAAVLGLIVLIATATAETSGQDELASDRFVIGERLTYNVSFERFSNVGFAEMYTVSHGKISGRDAVELRARIKTLDFVSAAFYLLDESRTVFASPETGMPLYITKTTRGGVLPKETVYDYLSSPATGLDIVTAVYQARKAGGVGSFQLREDDKTYTVDFQSSGTESVKTDAGMFDSTVSVVVSDYLTERGIKDLKINFANDPQHTPVLFRFQTAKGGFRAALASAKIIEPERPAVQPTPAPQPSPRAAATPRPTPSPEPYVENEPLSADLPFSIGEALDYSVSKDGRVVANARLKVAERKIFRGKDSLRLSAEMNSLGVASDIGTNDVLTAWVQPETLSPVQADFKFSGRLAALNQSFSFDQATGSVSAGEGNKIEVPIGTHTLLSLIYALRSFNLTPSKDLNNPINDTRVSVFWNSRPYIFTLRPIAGEFTRPGGEKVPVQVVTVNTGDPALDALGIKVWLSTDAARLPLRIAVGGYQADLTAVSRSSVK